MATQKKLSAYTPDERNANKGTQRGQGALEQSLRQYGAGRSLLADRNGKLIAGNKTACEAMALGLDEVIEVETNGRQLVVVKRTDLDLDTDAAARALAIADNRVGELSLEWDAAVLAELAQEIDLSQLFNENELARLTGQGAEVPDAQDLWRGMPEFEQEDQSDKYKSLLIHFATRDDYEAFAQLVNQPLTEKSTFIWYPYRPTHGVPGSMQGFTVENES